MHGFNRLPVVNLPKIHFSETAGTLDLHTLPTHTSALLTHGVTCISHTHTQLYTDSSNVSGTNRYWMTRTPRHQKWGLGDQDS